MSGITERLSAALAGRYRIERELGAGGMATVYLAEDLKHDRKVAIKVLKPELAAVLGAERFVQEIKTTAALQHPHILPLFDSGTADGFLFYVMPYIQGETVREKLNRETQFGVDEAVRIAREVADALDYAHRHGVIHRDIKPENILLHDGRPMVMDFGIALAVSAAAGGRMTETGLSLGTPHYMSPEQATAEKALTPRSDVYSLGTVLYEMLTGEPPHVGGSAQAIIMKIVTDRARPVTDIRKSVPAHVAAAVAKAVEKLPADRFESAAKFAEALGNPGYAPETMAGAGATRSSRATQAFAALSLLLAATTIWALRRPSPDGASAGASLAPSYETTIVLPDSAPMAYIGSAPLGVGLPAFAVSPDGAMLVYVAQAGASTRLYKRPLAASTVEPLAGTEGAYAPFFAPDGKSVGYFAGGRVHRVQVAGGAAPVSLAEIVLPYGGAWLPDGRIVVAADEGERLVAVPAAGGPAAPIGPTSLNQKAVVPEPLPGGRELLLTTRDHHFLVVSLVGGRTHFIGLRGAVDADSITESSELLSGSHPRYVASGHLLYHSLDGAVMAVPFDAGTLRVLGDAEPVLSGARLESVWGAAQLAITRDGTLIYARGENGRRTALVWRDAKGSVDTLKAFGREDFGSLDLSPDGNRLIVRTCRGQGECDREILNLHEGVRVPLFPKRSPDDDQWSNPGWDGPQRVFASKSGLSIDFTPDVAAVPDTLHVQVRDIARDGAVLFESGRGLRVAPSWGAVRGDTVLPGLRIAEPDPWGFQLRAGGEWVGYTASSEQAGDYVVYMARTRPPYERWRASPRGGEEPVWDPQGNLVYREGNRWMRVAPPRAIGERPGVATMVFAGPYLNVLGRSHDIAPDGRNLLIAGPRDTTTIALTVVTRWVDRLPAHGAKP